MNFIEAYKLMKQGKRCRCKSACSEEDAIYYYGDCCIRCEVPYINAGNQCVIDKEFIEATDWEIVDDKKTLSDKRQHHTGSLDPDECRECFPEDDVKASIKEYIKRCTKLEKEFYPDSDLRIGYEITAKKVFGEDLIE